MTSPCICARVRRAARALTNLYDAALAPVGITVAQFSLLRNVERLSRPHLSALAAATGLERSTIGRNLRLLAAAGLVRMDAGDDRREKLVRLTAAGVAVLDRAIPLWKRVQDTMERGLGQEGRSQLFELLADVERLTGNEAGAISQ